MTGVVPDRLLALQISPEQMRAVRKPAFVNTVATYSMNTATLNPELVTMLLPGFCYNPQRFAAIKMRLNRAMILGFCGGIAVCPGSRNVESARIAAMRFSLLLLEAGFYVEYGSFRVENIVMSVYAPFEINLPAIKARFSQCTEYKNSNFPGLSFRMGPETGIVFNVFVTGRVVITGSRDPEHSYRAWWWLRTHVLSECKMSSAPGTTSSARFRMSLHLRNEHFGDNCQKLSARYARRENGPLAHSRYADMLATPSLRTPMHTPSTPSMRQQREQPPAMRGAALHLDRVARLFQGHTLQCAYVSAPDDERAAISHWFSVLRASDAIADTERQNLALVAPHVESGCTGAMTAGASAASSAEMARRYVEQLAGAIGRERCRMVVGGNAPLHGHDIHCPWVSGGGSGGDQSPKWADERNHLEVALAGAVTDGHNDELERALRAHSGCIECDEHDAGDDDSPAMATARLYIMQLHALERREAVADRLQLPHVCDMSVDDVVEPERLFRLDRLRQRAADRAQPGAAFSV